MLTVAELQEITRFAITCATRVLPIFEQHMPNDTRPRQAIEAARIFVQSGKRSNRLRMSGFAAFKAASASTQPAASASAQAATQAVGAAYLHPIGSALQVKHILGAAAYAAYAAELAANSEQAGIDYADWAIKNAPASLVEVLKRYPNAASGGGRTGELLRQIDAALRA